MTPTKNQLDFVSDIEAGAAAIKQRGIAPSKASEVFEAGGRNAGELSYYAPRLAVLGHWDMLERLGSAFANLGLPVPLAIRRALDGRANIMPVEIDSERADSDCESLQLIPAMPEEGPVATGWEDAYRGKDHEEILAEAIKIIKQTPSIAARQKIAVMTASWFGA